MTANASPSISSASLSQLEDAIRKLGLPISRGIEKEGLRADSQARIAQTNHPEALGHPLTHSHITTDYSEALLELITGVSGTREELMQELEDIHRYVQHNIDDELLWSGSMPCELDGDESIRIAEYGDSNIGQLKHVYRQGLAVRYGRIMQSIAGLHFNFSLNDEFWQQHQQALGDISSLQDFKSEQYFALIRNFRRYSWLLMYLFGASPVLDHSFLSNDEHDLEAFNDESDTPKNYYKPYATSLRMGDLGYHNNAQASLNICFNTLNNFTSTLGEAIKTSYAPYEEIGIRKDDQFIQLNTNILQIENEYYSSIRPKRTTKSGERPTDALIERGVEYIEVRCLDLNPFLPLGISAAQVDFMDLFLMYCLLTDSPFIIDDECKEIDRNFSLTVNKGRDPELKLQSKGEDISIAEWGAQLLSGMRSIAEILDLINNDQRYIQALELQANKLSNASLTPSAEILAVMAQEKLSWLEFSTQLSGKHKLELTQSAECNDLADQAPISFAQASDIKAGDTQSFSDYLKAFNS